MLFEWMFKKQDAEDVDLRSVFKEEMYSVVLKDPVRIAQKTHHVSVIKTSHHSMGK